MKRVLVAAAFVAASSASASNQEAECLAEVIYQESRGEPLAGQIAVGHTLKTRRAQWLSRHRFRRGVCRLRQGQYHSRRIPPRDAERFRRLAGLILLGALSDPTRGATHFDRGRPHLRGYRIKAQIGHHTFYCLKEAKECT